MNFRAILEDDDAVSPVIGVILMVAITVILAAVIATFVLGLGEQVSDTAPQASFSFDYTEGGTDNDCAQSFGGDGSTTITHDGGDTIEAANLKITDSDGGENFFDACGYDQDSAISAGNSVSITMDSGDTLRVVWVNSQGTDSATIGKFPGPDA